MLRSWYASCARFAVQEDGPTAVEYAILLALIIVVCFAAISTLGSNVDETMEQVSPVLGS
jgi:pilus assembly protein Flp/PilA